MRVLIVDNNIDPDCWGAGDLRRLARLAPGATITVRRAPQEDLPREPWHFDRIIVSGSKTSVLEEAPWISALDEFIRRAVDAGKPYLGVCYGHQALARALGGKSTVRQAKRGEFGWARIERLAPSRLLEGLPDSFHSFAWHKDEVCGLPEGARALARSETCPIQAFELKSDPVFGIQFHPEREPAEAEKSLAARRKKGQTQDMLNAGLGRRLYDPKVGETLFRNFLEL